ncbi:MAG: FAD-binding protein [Christensenellaceae bacterium]|nr:FAD-binding protein [Christensenellaceae bacterium]
MKKILSVVLCLMIVFASSVVFANQESGTYTAGTYTATVPAMHGPLTVEVEVSDTAILSVKVTSHVETPGVGDVAAEQIPAAIVEQQSLAVDAVSGVTITTEAIKRAVEDCIKQANGDLELLKKPLEKTAAGDIEETADVIVVGGGGAGLVSAITALENGASVILIEKMGFLGGNSIVAGGIYNAPDPSKQDIAEFPGDLDSYVENILAEEPKSELHKELLATIKEEFEEYKKSDRKMFDSPSFFAVQTWNAGDNIGYLDMVKILCDGAYDGMKWVESLGMKYKPEIFLASGSLYPRTHYAVAEQPNGTGYISSFINKLKEFDNYTQMMNTTGVSLIMDGEKVVGVNAVGKDGNKVTLHANKGVVLATGGFGGNVKLRQEYCEGEKWPDLGPHVPTSNMPGVTGDGIFMARDAGAQLVNMEQIQLLHACNPITGATYDIVSADCFVNQEGKRFVREDGRRDEMSKAILAQTGGIMYCVFSADFAPDPATAKALGGMSLQYMLDHNISKYVQADTLEELAEKIGMPPEALVQTVKEFNSYVDGEAKDPLGRVAFSGVKIEKGPFYAYPRSPAVHHTMGGVLIDDKTRALNADGNIVPGLYCAGEITGVLHGGNRVGGNAIVDFVVFGRIAGENAAKGE